MDRYRSKLDRWLKNIFSNVYFQPPSSIRMHYPCAVYEFTSNFIEHADNAPFFWHKKYQITVIDRNPDTELPDLVQMLPYCHLDRTYQAEGLNHYSFTIYI